MRRVPAKPLDDDVHLLQGPDDPATSSNHSCDPSMWLDGPFSLAARHRIDPTTSSPSTSQPSSPTLTGTGRVDAAHRRAGACCKATTGEFPNCKPAMAATSRRCSIDESATAPEPEARWLVAIRAGRKRHARRVLKPADRQSDRLQKAVPSHNPSHDPAHIARPPRLRRSPSRRPRYKCPSTPAMIPRSRASSDRSPRPTTRTRAS